MLSQPNLAEIGVGAELGKRERKGEEEFSKRLGLFGIRACEDIPMSHTGIVLVLKEMKEVFQGIKVRSIIKEKCMEWSKG